MPPLLPALRADVEILPSRAAEHPGLLIRDPLQYADGILLVPPLLAACVRYLDGRHDRDDLEAALAGVAGPGLAKEALDHMVDTLGQRGFLDDERFARLRDVRRRAFADAPVREAAHVSTGYPEHPERLTTQLATWVSGGQRRDPSPTGDDSLIGVVAPHVSPSGGVATYASAYGALPGRLKERCFVVLGTSHYGRPNHFGLTRKPFRTPLGLTRSDPALVDELLGDGQVGFEVEDYCHAVEHSIEFQVLFLQHLYGPGVRVLPILCGPLIGGPGQPPERGREIGRALEALGELAARRADELFWVVGADLAHVGHRYGDRRPVRAGEGLMKGVAARDRERLDAALDGDSVRFWRMVGGADQDDLRWCGSSALYAFLRAVPGARGRLLHYDQWNIDPASVVSFAALAFSTSRRDAVPGPGASPT